MSNKRGDQHLASVVSNIVVDGDKPSETSCANPQHGISSFWEKPDGKVAIIGGIR
jgi:hypothetical protein